MSEGIRDFTGGPEKFPIDLGQGDTLRMRECPQGYEIRHLCKTGTGKHPKDFQIWNAPVVDTVNAGNHTLVKKDPLTITPSILCPVCGLHGFVTEGKWRSC